MSDIPTGAHVPVKILVRGLPLGEGASFDLVGRSALVTAVAATKKLLEWPGVKVERGDLEAIVWVEPGEVESTLARLSAEEKVVAVNIAA